jgi:pyrroloquinoline-quinone synthase
MSKFKNWAIDATTNNGWTLHRYHTFIEESNQAEYLRSQIPFFFAVQAFPRFLAKLVSQIETSEDRLLVVENLWEEHGHGNKNQFHTTTFKEFLTALGWDGEFHQNPWIQEWISKVLSKDMSAGAYAAYLAGIEYAYAPISKTIADHVKTLDLVAEQSHYAVHSELDWIHGDELLTVGVHLEHDEDVVKEAFNAGQDEFLELYNHMVIATAHEMKKVHEEGISFYYTREDSSPEIKAINDTCKKNGENNILMIASGGETIIDMLGLPCHLQIDAVDMNINQINLCKYKILELLADSRYYNKEENFSGKFEQVFLKIRTSFNYHGNGLLSDYIKESPVARQKLKYIVNELFSNENLSHVFSDRATKYSSESFAEHFYNVFVKACESKIESTITRRNIENIIDGIDIHPSHNTQSALKANHFKHAIQYIHGDFEALDVNKKYKVVSISNIGDWMSLEDYKKVILDVKGRLTDDGVIVCRKLLGDYNLKNLLVDCGFKVKSDNDVTWFYSEVAVGVNG